MCSLPIHANISGITFSCDSESTKVEPFLYMQCFSCRRSSSYGRINTRSCFHLLNTLSKIRGDRTAIAVVLGVDDVVFPVIRSHPVGTSAWWNICRPDSSFISSSRSLLLCRTTRCNDGYFENALARCKAPSRLILFDPKLSTCRQDNLLLMLSVLHWFNASAIDDAPVQVI